jgi:hypothetical protein
VELGHSDAVIGAAGDRQRVHGGGVGDDLEFDGLLLCTSDIAGRRRQTTDDDQLKRAPHRNASPWATGPSRAAEDLMRSPAANGLGQIIDVPFGVFSCRI